MKRNWKIHVASVALSSSIILSGLPAFADDAATAASPTPVIGTYYQLTDALQADLKSLLNEKVTAGTRLGAVVELKNDSNKITRVPDYELRLKAADGTEYTLKASATNAKSVQPMSKVTLSYYLLVDRQDEFQLSELSWVDVDWYTYPKTETPKLVLDVSSQAWKGANAQISDPALIKSWGDSFGLQVLDSPLNFKPVSYRVDSSSSKPTHTVEILVENPGEFKETLPEFTLQGRSDSGLFIGQRAEQGTITLDPGEKKYIHYLIPTDPDTVLKSVDVLTPESFVQLDANGNAAVTAYTVGRYNVALPAKGTDLTETTADYAYNSPIEFDSLNKLIDPNVSVSLVEFGMHDSQGVGYQTAVAKFILTNKSAEPIVTPNFQSEIDTPDGSAYSGNRQANAPQTLMPNLSHVVTYSFIVPDEVDSQHLKLRLLDAQTSAPAKTSIAALNIAAQPSSSSQLDTLSFYPFSVKVNWWVAQYMATTSTSGEMTYSYKVKMDLDVMQQDGVVVDQDFSKMEIALVDDRDRTLGQTQLSFVNDNNGMGKLTSGQLDVTIPNLRTDDMQNNLSLNIYETITTPTGTAKRLVATLKH